MIAVDVQNTFDINPRVTPESSKEDLLKHITVCHNTILTLFENQTLLRSRYFQMLRLMGQMWRWAERSSVTAINSLFFRRLQVWAGETLNFNLKDEIDNLLKEEDNNDPKQ